MIKLIIFDVGGVIDTFDESQYIQYITKKLGLPSREFAYTLLPLLDRMEVGKMNTSLMLNLLARKFNVDVKDLEWDSAFIKLNKVNHDVVNLINRLSKKYKIAILSNVSKSRHIVKMEHYLHQVKYDAIFTSCYLKMRKPELKIYRFVLKKLNFKPEDALFVDNLIINVQGARKAGIKSIQFINYSDLIKKLRKFGISW